MKTVFERMCISFSRIVPGNIRDKFRIQIKYAGRDNDPDGLVGFGLLNGFSVFFIALVLVRLFDLSGYFIAIFALAPLIVLFLQYLYYFLLADRRGKFVDRVLPDALSLIASNLFSGLTPYHAVKSSIRPDFGPLGDAFQIATNKSLGTKSFTEALNEMNETIKSDSLKRSMKLFSTAIESGSNVSKLLESLAQDITDRYILKNDLVTSTKTNAMFILFMVIVGAPILMSVSIFFIDIVGNIQETSGLDASAGAEFDIGFGTEVAIDSDFLKIYAYILLFVTGLLASYFSGTINEGDGKSGLKVAPVIVGASYVIFIISSYFIRQFLGGFF